MNTFLEFVAQDILSKYGTDLSRTAVIFPNKRASLFLNGHLARMAGKPVWSPAYFTISDLFAKQSPLIIADEIKLVCDLHGSFVKYVGESETLDHFYGWGQILLNDFDDIDKNMVEANKVFANLRDIHEYDTVGFLNDAQKTALMKFFSNFSEDHETLLQKKFLQLWSHLADIYDDYRERLRKQGLAYEGMLYRDVVEQQQLQFKHDRYIFVGFNLLTKVEKALFNKLKEMGKAHFYWDFDHYYMPKKGQTTTENEAGKIIAQHLEQFPNELDNHSTQIYGQMGNHKNISFVSAPTENIQARYISHWLRADDRISHGSRTAIVLCDENLLTTAIHCLPPETDKVNVTTGFPLQSALITSFVNHLFMLAIFGGRKHYRHLVRHPYAKVTGFDKQIPNISQKSSAIEILNEISNAVKTIALADAEKTSTFNREALFQMYTLVNRLISLVREGDLNVDTVTMQKLLCQLIQSTAIPFNGEPVEGIQMMGVLETRCLDFEHLLILSCNEGNMPKGVNVTSFIPHSIRSAYGLTTSDHKVAIYSYYFHRMLQRANDITIAYNNSTEEGKTGEMSRFMIQLLVESGFNISRTTLQARQEQELQQPKEIEKNGDIMARLHEIAEKGAYPTLINKYMRCQLQFYFQNILDIDEPHDDEDGIDNRMFGNIFHRAAQIIYTPFNDSRKTVTRSDIEEIQKHKERIERAVDQAFEEEYQKRGHTQPFAANTNTGLHIINRQVIITFINRLLTIDMHLAPFVILGLEKKVSDTITVNNDNGQIARMKVSGIIDRLDMTQDHETKKWRIRVVDYKTGRDSSTKPKGIEDVFTRPINTKQHLDYYLQTMLYSDMISRSTKYNPQQLPVAPALLFIQNAAGEDYSPILLFGKEPILDIQQHSDDFKQHLQQILNEMFDPAIPFTPTPDQNICATCPYRQICGL